MLATVPAGANRVMGAVGPNGDTFVVRLSAPAGASTITGAMTPWAFTDVAAEYAGVLPQPGEHLVVLDGAGEPRAIVRATHVEMRYFNEIDDTFAFEAGEGDLTLRWWLTAHRQDYAERGAVEGFEAHERMELVLEHFERVWPQPL